METATLINKEDIINLKFIRKEVLGDLAAIKQRHTDLHKATTLGNVFHSKIKIVFMSEEGLKKVETTIWATTEETVTLKGGILIPVQCILQVEI